MNRRTFIMSAGAATVSTHSTAAMADTTAEGTYVLPEEHMPRIVRLRPGLPPNQIHVVPETFSLYWTLEKNRAIRYSVGIGRPGLYESGAFYVGAKKEWPSWRPTDEMIARDPSHYARFADGMPGGPNNPLGARALYLFQPGRGDSMLRIHGTNRPRTIGHAVSNGCARLVNSHIVDLYNRVPMDVRVVLHPTKLETS